MLRERSEAAEADVMQAIGVRAYAHARRELRKEQTSIVALRPKPDLPAARALQFFIRKHAGPRRELRRRLSVRLQGTPVAPIFFDAHATSRRVDQLRQALSRRSQIQLVNEVLST